MPLSAHPAAPPRTRRTELDFLRVLAMAAVILGHVTAAYIHNESSFTLLGMNPAFFLNQAARFSVPMFFLLSGFSLGLREQPLSSPAFWKGRFLRILPPLPDLDPDLRAVEQEPGPPAAPPGPPHRAGSPPSLLYSNHFPVLSSLSPAAPLGGPAAPGKRPLVPGLHPVPSEPLL